MCQMGHREKETERETERERGKTLRNKFCPKLTTDTSVIQENIINGMSTNVNRQTQMECQQMECRAVHYLSSDVEWTDLLLLRLICLFEVGRYRSVQISVQTRMRNGSSSSWTNPVMDNLQTIDMKITINAQVHRSRNVAHMSTHTYIHTCMHTHSII